MIYRDLFVGESMRIHIVAIGQKPKSKAHLLSGAILEVCLRKSSKSPKIDVKIKVLESENPKIDPYRTDAEHLGSPKSGTQMSATPAFAGKYGPFRQFGDTK